MLAKHIDDEDKAKKVDEEEEESGEDDLPIESEQDSEKKKKEPIKPLNAINKKPEKVATVDIKEFKEPAWLSIEFLSKPKEEDPDSVSEEDSLDVISIILYSNTFR